MDIRTFLRPRAGVIGPPVLVGGRAPTDGVIDDTRSTVVAFLRHVGCPFAEATLIALDGSARQHPGIGHVAVTQAADGATTWWWRSVVGTTAVRLVGDPERRVFAAWGLGLTDARHSLGGDVLREVMRLRRQGIRNRHPAGTRWQSAGSFAVDGDSVVRWRHIPRHAADLPDFAVAVAALQGPRRP